MYGRGRNRFYEFGTTVGLVKRAGLIIGCISLLVLGGSGEGDPDLVSTREQKQLPTSPGSLIQDLCFQGDSATDRQEARRTVNPQARKQFRALEGSLRRHPEAIVKAEITLAESPEPETRELTVRELAEAHLEGAQESEVPPGERECYRRGQARLERLLKT